MIKPTGPCLGCTTRYERCHSTCERYQTFQEELMKWKELVSGNKLEDLEQDKIRRDGVARAAVCRRRNKVR